MYQSSKTTKTEDMMADKEFQRTGGRNVVEFLQRLPWMTSCEMIVDKLGS